MSALGILGLSARVNVNLFRRSRLPSPPPAPDVMPPRPPECRPPAPEPGWASAWASNGALNASYDPTGGGPIATATGKRRQA